MSNWKVSDFMLMEMDNLMEIIKQDDSSMSPEVAHMLRERPITMKDIECASECYYLRAFQEAPDEDIEVDRWMEANSTLVSSLSKNGWTFASGASAKQFQIDLFESTGNLQALVTMLEVSSISNDDWISGSSVWEEKMSPINRREVRSEFIAQCMAKAVTPEWLRDSKQRWINAEFSAVTREYLIIGDVFVSRRGDPLLLKDESDISTSKSEIGRKDLTYALLRTPKMQGALACRPKINGERFVLSVAPSGTSKGVLQGFRSITVPEDFVPQVVEYYAGDFYTIFPYVSRDQLYEISYVRAGQLVTETALFRAHPWWSPLVYSAHHKEVLGTHKYDGLMVWDGSCEYRSKWRPTVELDHNGAPWEACMSSSGPLIVLRPRPGKVGLSNVAALTKLRFFPPASVISKIILSHRESNALPPILSSHGQTGEKVNHIGSKVLFLTATSAGFDIVGIREPLKRWDLIGGRREGSESPIDTALREIQEETELAMDASQLVYLGHSRENTDTGVWISHVYAAMMPSTVFFKGKEAYPVSHFQTFNHSSAGRPRQVWVSRHMDFVATIAPKAHQLYALICLATKTCPSFLITSDIFSSWMESYFLRDSSGLRFAQQKGWLQSSPASLQGVLADLKPPVAETTASPSEKTDQPWRKVHSFEPVTAEMLLQQGILSDDPNLSIQQLLLLGAHVGPNNLATFYMEVHSDVISSRYGHYSCKKLRAWLRLLAQKKIIRENMAGDGQFAIPAVRNSST